MFVVCDAASIHLYLLPLVPLWIKGRVAQTLSPLLGALSLYILFSRSVPHKRCANLCEMSKLVSKFKWESEDEEKPGRGWVFVFDCPLGCSAPNSSTNGKAPNPPPPLNCRPSLCLGSVKMRQAPATFCSEEKKYIYLY